MTVNRRPKIHTHITNFTHHSLTQTHTPQKRIEHTIHKRKHEVSKATPYAFQNPYAVQNAKDRDATTKTTKWYEPHDLIPI